MATKKKSFFEEKAWEPEAKSSEESPTEVDARAEVVVASSFFDDVRAGKCPAIELTVAVLHGANGERLVANWSADAGSVENFAVEHNSDLRVGESLQLYTLSIGDKATWTAR